MSNETIATETIGRYIKLLQTNQWLLKESTASIRIITNEAQLRSWQKDNQMNLGVLVEDQYITVIRDLVVFSDGAVRPYNRIINTAAFSKGAMGVAVLPLVDGKILLIRIFRHPIRQWSLEIPRGFGESNLTPTELARKELQEEIGGKIHKLIDLGLLHSNTGLEANAVNLFYAELKGFGKAQEGEAIEEIHLVEPSEFRELISRGEITDSFTIAAYFRAVLKNLV